MRPLAETLEPVSSLASPDSGPPLSKGVVLLRKQLTGLLVLLSLAASYDGLIEQNWQWCRFSFAVEAQARVLFGQYIVGASWLYALFLIASRDRLRRRVLGGAVVLHFLLRLTEGMVIGHY